MECPYLTSCEYQNSIDCCERLFVECSVYREKIIEDVLLGRLEIKVLIDLTFKNSKLRKRLEVN